MTISIVSVCYNNLGGLQETWRSVLGQTSPDWEWLVIDGDSADGTQAFLRSLEDPRVRWVSEKDNGIYDAMNKGLTQAEGDYVTFLNSGDIFSEPNVLEEITRCVQAGMPDICYGDAYEKAESGELLRKTAHSHKRVWYGMFTHHQAMFYRRKFVGDQRYPTHYRIGGDYAFTAEILARGGTGLYLPKPLCVFERGGVSERAAAAGRADVWAVQQSVLRMAAPGASRRSADASGCLRFEAVFLRSFIRRCVFANAWNPRSPGRGRFHGPGSVPGRTRTPGIGHPCGAPISGGPFPKQCVVGSAHKNPAGRLGMAAPPAFFGAAAPVQPGAHCAAALDGGADRRKMPD